VRREKRRPRADRARDIAVDPIPILLLPARPSGAIICQITVTLDTATSKGGAA
jgi:hypothetical protein